MPLPLPKLNAPIRTEEHLKVGSHVRLGRTSTDQLRFRVVRTKEAFTIQDPTGSYFRAKLLSMEDRNADGHVYEKLARSPESPLDLTLVCAVLGRQRMIFVSQKSAEMGVTRLLPVITETSVQQEGLEHEKAHAWQSNAIRGARQCRRGIIPEVQETQPLAAVLAGAIWQEAEARYYLDDRAEGAAELTGSPLSVCLAVGPEGGWSDLERAQLHAAGAVPLVFGGRVLRAETAVLAGLSLVQHHFGDLK